MPHATLFFDADAAAAAVADAYDYAIIFAATLAIICHDAMPLCCCSPLFAIFASLRYFHIDIDSRHCHAIDTTASILR